MSRHSASTVKRSSHPPERAPFLVFPGGDCFCLRHLLSDESWRIELTQKTMEMDFCVVFCDHELNVNIKTISQTLTISSPFTLVTLGKITRRLFGCDFHFKRPSKSTEKWINVFTIHPFDNYVTHTFWSWSLALISKLRKVIGSQFMRARLPATSYPGSFLLGSKDPGRRWSRDLLKSSRFLINYLGFLYDNHTKCRL
jgi:hypothetical protein